MAMLSPPMTGGAATTQALNNFIRQSGADTGLRHGVATISGGTATTNGASSIVIAVGTQGLGDAIANQTGER